VWCMDEQNNAVLQAGDAVCVCVCGGGRWSDRRVVVWRGDAIAHAIIDLWWTMAGHSFPVSKQANWCSSAPLE